MPKTGRNDPCPCGSGKKYKQCCLEKDRAADLAPAIAQRIALQAQMANRAALRKDYQAELLEIQTTLQEAQALDAASNAVVDLVHATASMRPNKPPGSCWFATPRCTMATIGSAWSTRPAASSARPPTATAR